MQSSNLAFILVSKQSFVVHGLFAKLNFVHSADLSAFKNQHYPFLPKQTLCFPKFPWPRSDLHFCLPTQHWNGGCQNLYKIFSVLLMVLIEGSLCNNLVAMRVSVHWHIWTKLMIHFSSNSKLESWHVCYQRFLGRTQSFRPLPILPSLWEYQKQRVDKQTEKVWWNQTANPFLQVPNPKQQKIP